MSARGAATGRRLNDPLDSEERNTAGMIELAFDRIERDPKAGTSKFSQTLQTRRTTSALLVIGLPRTSFRARSAVDKNGEYQPCHASIYGDAEREVVRRNARVLASLGFNVYLVGKSAWVNSGDSVMRRGGWIHEQEEGGAWKSTMGPEPMSIRTADRGGSHAEGLRSPGPSGRPARIFEEEVHDG